MTVTGKIQKFRMREISIEEIRLLALRQGRGERMEPRPAPALRWRAARSEARGRVKNDGETQASTKGHHLGCAWSARRWWSGAGRRRGGRSSRPPVSIRSCSANPTRGSPRTPYSRLWLDLARRMDDEFFGMDARRLKSGSFAFMSRCAIHEQTWNRR